MAGAEAVRTDVDLQGGAFIGIEWNDLMLAN